MPSPEPAKDYLDSLRDSLFPGEPPISKPPKSTPSQPKPPSLLERAKSGDSQAMTEVLNSLLQPRGIVSLVTLKLDVLLVVLEGKTTLDKEEYVTYIRKFVTQLDLIFLNKIVLTAKRRGSTFTSWTQEIDLNQSEAKSPSFFNSVTSNISGMGGAITESFSQAGQSITQTVNKNQLSNEPQNFQEHLAERMMGLFDDVIKERQKYYKANPEKIPSLQQVSRIIEDCAKTNTAIVGALNLVPGPLGMAVMIPEILGTIRCQIMMIYDISIAYDQHRVLNRELLASVFTYSLGQGTLGVLTVHGSKILVKRASIKLFHQIVKQLGYKIGKRALKSMVSKYIPVAGAMAMAAWANHSTREIGKKATIILKQKIEYSAEVIDDLSNLPIDVEASTVEDSAVKRFGDFSRIQILIKLMKVDGKVDTEERQYIHLFLKDANVSEQEKVSLLMAIDNETQFSIDYSQFVNSPDDAIGLLIDMVALAKCNNDFHITQKMYIKQVGKQIGIAASDIEELIAS